MLRSIECLVKDVPHGGKLQVVTGANLSGEGRHFPHFKLFHTGMLFS